MCKNSFIGLLLLICLAFLLNSCETNTPTFYGPEGASQREIYFNKINHSGFNWNLYTISANGTNEQVVLDSHIITSQPHNNKMTITSMANPSYMLEMFVCNLNGSGRVTIPRGNYYPVNLVISPKINKVLFTTSVNHILCVVNSDGSNLTEIANNIYNYEFIPKFSPDGNKIAFYSTPPGSSTKLYVINSNGTNLTILKDNISASQLCTIDWSIDSRKIAFQNIDSLGKESIYTINVDGSAYTNLTQATGRDINPEWSPDGTKLIFTTIVPGARSDIAVINSNGTGRTKVTNTVNENERYAHWSLDGSRILFTSSVSLSDLSTLYVYTFATANKLAIADSVSHFAYWNLGVH